MEQAPEALEQMPARPPRLAAVKPKTTVVHNPTKGLTPATKAKAVASGIMAKATAIPAVVAFQKRPVGRASVSLSLLPPRNSLAFSEMDSSCAGVGAVFASLLVLLLSFEDVVHRARLLVCDLTDDEDGIAAVCCEGVMNA